MPYGNFYKNVPINKGSLKNYYLCNWQTDSHLHLYGDKISQPKDHDNLITE
jgi:hypothetical protein